MSAERSPLPLVSCPGLHLDDLGSYLASLGLLEVAARTWPGVRGAFQDRGFCLVGGPRDRAELATAVRAVARAGGFRRYDRAWLASQGRDTKAGSANNVSAWRSGCSEEECDLLDAHLLPVTRLCYNPVLGTGGNSGRRDFAKGWAEAVGAVGRGDPVIDADLEALLAGEAITVRDHYNGGSWFPQRVSPWAMALACEGLPLLAGKISRRLGANTRRQGAFPFTIEAAAPVRENEAGRVLAEVWMPVWRDRALSVPEVAALFARGRAEIGIKGARAATTAAAFAGAILQRGIDAGITELRRYLLTRTTSAQTFESTLAQAITVAHEPAQAAAQASERVVEIRDALPRDERRANRWIFRGLRGPVDAALIDLAANPGDLDTACALLDALAAALGRVDVNKTFRSAEPSVPLLPVSWLAELFSRVAPPAEATVAMGIASLLPGTQTRSKVGPFLAYRLGVERAPKLRRLAFPREAPARRVWTGSGLARDLGLVLRRRLLDAGAQESPFAARATVPISLVAAFLREDLDEEQLRRWIDRMCLFDWQPRSSPLPVESAALGPVDGTLSLYGFLKPLFHPWPPKRAGSPPSFLSAPSPATSVAAVARIAARLDAGDVEGALLEARTRYRAAGYFPASLGPSPRCDPARLLGALLIPTSPRPLVTLAQRWLSPEKRKETAE